MADTLQTDRTRVRRIPNRGAYDRATIHSILDAGFLCHLGFVVEEQPFVIPTLYGRDGDTLYVHGSAASRMQRAIATGVPVCVTVTLVDGLVLARSAFHHSMNYRSVVVLGQALSLTDRDAKLHALRTISEHLIPGRWDDVRPPNEQELMATTVLGIPIVEASAKVRLGAPGDDDADYALPIWAGVVPVRMTAETPVDDDRLLPGVTTPGYATDYNRRFGQ